MLHKTNNLISDIVLDFDGTCTIISVIYESYLEKYRQKFNEQVEPLTDIEWKEALNLVKINSPKVGWTLGGCPSAPAGADPYILAYETASYILRHRSSKKSLPANLHTDAAEGNVAPWREDALDTFQELIKLGINIHFISNSSTKTILERLHQLWGEGNPLPNNISVESDAAKFRICELTWETESSIPKTIRNKFINLPLNFTAFSQSKLERPVYLHRGAYFEAIYRVFKDDWSKLSSTVFCGDIWEMDLAMPYSLGAKVHLIERAEPFSTYDYERNAIFSYGNSAKISEKLSGILKWL